MGYVTPFDPLLRFAIVSGLLVFLLTFVLLVAIIVLRAVTDRRERLEAALAERWHPVFFHAVEGMPYVAPRLLGRDREVILLVWIHFVESIGGEARRRLRRLARELQFAGTAVRLLERRNFRSRLLAVAVLGRMKSRRAWSQLVRLAADPNPALSMLAARALLQIDARAGLPIVIGQIVRRDDWPAVRLAAMLDEVPSAQLSEELLRTLREVGVDAAPRLLPLLDDSASAKVWPVLAPLLRAERPPAILVAALKACSDPRAIVAVRYLAGHGEWIVRAQAAAALGRLGFNEDVPRLQALLGDPEWWVRYRAGLALTRMPFVSRQRLVDLAPQLTDPYAADMLRQVLAETAPGAAA